MRPPRQITTASFWPILNARSAWQGARLQTTIDPGQTVEGTIVSAFRMSKADWDARKDLNLTFAFSYQPNLVLAPKTAVIEQ